MVDNELKQGIWLEVADVRFETGVDQKPECRVQLKGDREHPKPVWWLVDEEAGGEKLSETYKAILREMDRKRIVLACLGCNGATASPSTDSLICKAFRFQSPDVGSR